MRTWQIAGAALLLTVAFGVAVLAGESHQISRYDGYVGYVSKDGRQLGLKPDPESQDITVYIVDERCVGAKKIKEAVSQLHENQFVTIRYYIKHNVHYMVGFGWPYREAGKEKKEEGEGGGGEE